MPYHPPPANAPWYTPPGNPSMVPPEQRVYHSLQPVYAHTVMIQQYPVSSASAPTLADHDQLERHRAPERASMPGPVQAALFMPYTASIARAPTMADCDEIERRRALGLPPLQWLAPTPMPADPFGYLSAPPVRVPPVPQTAPAPLISQVAPIPVHPSSLTSPQPQQKGKKKKAKKLSKNQQKKLDKARWAAEKAERAALKASQPPKPPPPPTPAELRRIEERKRIAALPYSPYVEPPKPFPPPGICTYESHIAYKNRRKPLPSRWATMCGTYASGPYAGYYGQEYWEGCFRRCMTAPDGKHEYDRDLPDAPEDSFLAAALRRGEIHPGDTRGEYIDCEDGRSIPFPPHRKASQTWQQYIDNEYNPYDSEDDEYIYPEDHRKRVPVYRPPSPTARRIPWLTRELLPDTELSLNTSREQWDAEVEEVRKLRIEEHIGNHGLWVRKEYWDEELEYNEAPVVYMACNKVPSGTLVAAAIDEGKYPESDLEDEGAGATAVAAPAS